MQVYFLDCGSVPAALAEHFQLDMRPGVTLKEADRVVAMAACGCAQVCRRDAYKGCKGKGTGLELQIVADNPINVVRCQLCDNARVSQSAKSIAAAIKQHIRERCGVHWLCVAEMQLEPKRCGGKKRADLMLIPQHARALSSAVAVEIDPSLHFENPARFARDKRCILRSQDAARHAAMKRDEDKDEVYKQLDVFVVRITRGAWLEEGMLTDKFWHMFDETLAQASATPV